MTKQSIVLKYGAIAGVILIGALAAALLMGMHDNEWGMAFGFLSMFIALSFVFVGVKRYRDEELGGVIRFWPALRLGLGIALFASLFYVLGWEAYLFATDYAYAKVVEEFYPGYTNALYRIPVTFTEISPVVMVVPLISAALLRNPRFMPAHPRG